MNKDKVRELLSNISATNLVSAEFTEIHEPNGKPCVQIEMRDFVADALDNLADNFSIVVAKLANDKNKSNSYFPDISRRHIPLESVDPGVNSLLGTGVINWIPTRGKGNYYQVSLPIPESSALISRKINYLAQLIRTASKEKNPYADILQMDGYGVPSMELFRKLEIAIADLVEIYSENKEARLTWAAGTFRFFE